MGAFSLGVPTAPCLLGKSMLVFFGELVFSYHSPTVPRRPFPSPSPLGGSFYLCYVDPVGVTLSHEPQLLALCLIRENGSPATTGRYLVDMLS